MARGRMISATIGESRKFAALASDRHRLMYLMVLPHVDKAGRFEADAVVIRSKCLMRLDVELSEVEAWLKDGAMTGLLRVYDARGLRVLEIVDFAKHNTPHHKEPKSELPAASEGVPCYTQESNDAPSMSQAYAKHEPTLPIIEVKGSKEKERKDLSIPAKAEPQTSDPVEAEPRHPKDPQESEPPVNLTDLIEIWNEERGQLRAVRNADVALADENLVRLTERFVRRHRKRRDRDGILELFRSGIAAVRIDPHWLGSRADKPTRTGPPYGIDSYLRHVESKAEAAADLAATPPPSGAPPGPTRPFAVDDLLQHNVTGEVGMIDELLPGNKARMNTGDTWNLAEVYRCNN